MSCNLLISNHSKMRNKLLSVLSINGEVSIPYTNITLAINVSVKLKCVSSQDKSPKCRDNYVKVRKHCVPIDCH
jgi:hypothetical protein